MCRAGSSGQPGPACGYPVPSWLGGRAGNWLGTRREEAVVQTEDSLCQASALGPSDGLWGWSSGLSLATHELDGLGQVA